MNKKKYDFYENEPIQSIVELLQRSERLYRYSSAIKYKKQNQICVRSYTDLLSDCKTVAMHLLTEKKQYQHIALLGASSYEWVAAYIGTIFAGKVIVPLDKELSCDDLQNQIKQADVDLLFYDKKNEQKAQEINESIKIPILSIENIDNLSFGKASLPAVEPDKLSTILFTSGTTGSSKGVMLTQRNIASNVIQGLGAVDLQHNRDTIMSVLPMNHAYEFTCTVLGMLYKGVPICISTGIRYVQKELKQFHPTVMFVVPLFVETLYKNIELNIKKQHKEKAFCIGVKLCRMLKKIHIDITDKVFAEVKEAFGGKLKIIMCGGALLGEDLIRNYNDIGINLFQGYGLTECSPLLTVNFDYYHRPNSVGKIVAGNEAKVVNGEIWARGLSVSSGYYNNPEETAKAFEDGWFKTGDIGYIDDDGFIFIQGRKKNLIILSNGKNVAAEELEALINKIEQVEEVVVFGEKDIITAEIYSQSEEQDNIRKAIAEINLTLPSFKQIDKVIFRNEPFEKTTTKKIKRK